jgi:hypothetical protein
MSEGNINVPNLAGRYMLEFKIKATKKTKKTPHPPKKIEIE